MKKQIGKSDQWRLFNPEITEIEYFQIKQLLNLGKVDIINQLDKLTKTLNLQDSNILFYTALLVLRDLLQLGWNVCVKNKCIYVCPPTGKTVHEQKENIRTQLIFGRNEQLTSTRTRQFIYSMEHPSKSSGMKPITCLIVDGQKLYRQLQEVKQLPLEKQFGELRKVCSPYLQLVINARDIHTNIPLMSIWRYFRHSWSLKYLSCPGRQMFYLVRDAAQPNHPIIGIAGLSNTVIKIAPRDEALGWTISGLLNLIDKKVVSDIDILNSFKNNMKKDYSEIYINDFKLDPDIECIGNDDIERISLLAKQYHKERKEIHSNTADYKKSDIDLSPEQLLQSTKSPLYRIKRAKVLKDILIAYRIISSWEGSIRDLVETTKGRWAVTIALRQLKNRYVGTHMMEITICGAVPPYNNLLGGKLVCLLLMSPKIIEDYYEKYKNTISIIASQMAGKPIVKEPVLMFLGTTSLYPSNSAQYNRVKLPHNTTEDQIFDVSYEYLGKTEGYGAMNFSEETEKALTLLAHKDKNIEDTGQGFGNGPSPKLRKLRDGFEILGISETNLIRHGFPRIIYGVKLAKNVERVLLGVDKTPNMIINSLYKNSEQKIVDFWLKRWLMSRINYEPALLVLGESTPVKEKVSCLMPNTNFELV